MMKQLDNAFIATMEMVILLGDNHLRVVRLLRECIGIAKSAYWLDLISGEDYTCIYRSISDSVSLSCISLYLRASCP